MASPGTTTADQFKQYLKKEGLAFTPQRLAVAEFIINKKGHHFSTEELVAELRDKGTQVSRATVYRTISHLHQAGFLREVALNSTQVFYEFIANVRHHEHLVCEKCGKIIEFTDPPLEKAIEAVAVRNGITMTRHTVQIFGICPDCRKKTAPHQRHEKTDNEKKIKPLSQCVQGETVFISRIHGSSVLRKRLLEMGFLKGKKLLIVKYAPLRDPMEVSLGSTHMSLRIGEAAGIDVVPSEESNDNADT